MRTGSPRRGAIGAIVAGVLGLLVWAAPAAADAGSCSLSGSGREGATDTTRYEVPPPILLASMIFVDFPDHQATAGETPPNSFGGGLTTRAEGYIGQVSYGKTQMDVQLGSSWLRMDHNASFYDPSTFAGQRAYMLEAIQHADAAGFDFSGRPTVFVVAAPTDGARPNTQAFSALDSEGISVDGTNVRWGATVGDDSRYPDPNAFWPNYGSKVLSHELNHTFGLPDLYRGGVADFGLQHQDAGPWDPMGWPGLGAHLVGWHRQKLGWLGPSDLVCVQGEATATLSPIESSGGTKMLIAKTSASTAYVAEARRPTGYDSEMCDDGGVLIYRVDANGGNAFNNGIAPIVVKSANPPDPSDPFTKCVALSNATYGVGPGEVSHFGEGPVTVDVLSGTPASGYTLRMTGPAPAQSAAAAPAAGSGATGQAPRAAKCKKKHRAADARKKCRKRKR